MAVNAAKNVDFIVYDDEVFCLVYLVVVVAREWEKGERTGSEEDKGGGYKSGRAQTFTWARPVEIYTCLPPLLPPSTER